MRFLRKDDTFEKALLTLWKNTLRFTRSSSGIRAGEAGRRSRESLRRSGDAGRRSRDAGRARRSYLAP